MGEDAALLDHVTSANIACGFHAGDPGTIHRTVKLAIEKGVAVGAHPSLQTSRLRPPLNRSTPAKPTTWFCTDRRGGRIHPFTGRRLSHVKPHARYTTWLQQTAVWRAQSPRP